MTDYNEYIEEKKKEWIEEDKKKRYGKNWKKHIKGGVSPKNKLPIQKPQKTQKYKGGGMAGMRRFNRGGKV
jgi:hypothetical protein